MNAAVSFLAYLPRPLPHTHTWQRVWSETGRSPAGALRRKTAPSSGVSVCVCHELLPAELHLPPPTKNLLHVRRVFLTELVLIILVCIVFEVNACVCISCVSPTHPLFFGKTPPPNTHTEEDHLDEGGQMIHRSHFSCLVTGVCSSLWPPRPLPTPFSPSQTPSVVPQRGPLRVPPTLFFVLFFKKKAGASQHCGVAACLPCLPPSPPCRQTRGSGEGAVVRFAPACPPALPPLLLPCLLTPSLPGRTVEINLNATVWVQCLWFLSFFFCFLFKTLFFFIGSKSMTSCFLTASECPHPASGPTHPPPPSSLIAKKKRKKKQSVKRVIRMLFSERSHS